MSSEPVPPRMSYAQVGAWLGRSVSHVHRLANEHGLPSHRSGRRVWFDRNEVAAWLAEQDEESDNRIQPVRPLGRHGVQNVWPSQTIGDFEHCWCGDVLDHDWEGKEAGAPHPHDHERAQVVVVQQHEPEDRPHIEQRVLRGYHGTLKKFISQCVNQDGLRFRQGNNETILYPLDDSRPITVYARNTDQQLRGLERWYAAHVQPFKGQVQESNVRDLAAKVNDPVEHPSSTIQFQDTPADPATYLPPQPNQSTDSAEPDEDVEPEWVTYVTDEGEAIENFETNGELVRCRECLGTENEYVSSSRRGIGGHNRMLHRDTSNLRTPEALEKATDTKRYNRLRAQVQDAHEALGAALGIQQESAKVKALQAENKGLRDQVTALAKRVEDAEARLALAREAFRGVEGL
jgi:excisionase family DNA binding protein